MKKWISLILAILLLVSLVGCGQSRDSSATKKKPTPVQTTPTPQPITNKRVSSCTIYNSTSGTTQTYAITWQGDICAFTMTENGYDPCPTTAEFDPATGAFTVHRQPDQEDSDDMNDVTMCLFDAEGRINAYTGMPVGLNNNIAVSYDENGWPSADSLKSLGCEAFPEKMQFSRAWAGMASTDYSVNTYMVGTLGASGQVVKADLLSVTTYSSGEKEESLQEDKYRFTYDDDGDLIKYASDSGYVEFTYSDQTIGHNWERLIPLLCFDFSYVFLLPLFWNV